MAEQTTNIVNQGTGGGFVPIDLSIISTSATPATGLGPNVAARQNIVLGDPAASGNLANVNAYGALTTFSAKRGGLLTNTNLAATGASATFTSAWFDSTLDGACTVTIGAYQVNASSYNLAYGQLYVQTCDDTTNTNTLQTATQTNLNNNTPNIFSVQLKQRYWRVVCVNNLGVATTTFELTFTISTNFPSISLFDPVSGLTGTINNAASDGFYPPGYLGLNTNAMLYGYDGSTLNSLDRLRSVHTGHLVTSTSPLKSRTTFSAIGLAGSTSETALTMTTAVSGVAGSGGSYTVAAGKVLRISAIRTATRAATGACTFRIRSGSTSGPIEWAASQFYGATTLNNAETSMVIPDGTLEFTGGTVLYFTNTAASTSQLLDFVVVGYLFNDPS